MGVLACARNTAALQAKGFATLRVDLANPACHDPEFWRGHLSCVTGVINAAGLLTATSTAMTHVHETAPKAVCAALPDGCSGVLISAVGLGADTPFAKARLAGEAVALNHGHTVLRAGMVLADTSYGGSSVVRALAALPWGTPVVGDGAQSFDPIHAADLADVAITHIEHPSNAKIITVGGPQTLTQADMIAAYRAWMGKPKARIIKIPLRLAEIMGRIGDFLRLGPISSTAVAQLSHGIHAKTEAANGAFHTTPRGVSDILQARLAGTQDIWHARLYLLKPVIRLTLAALWLASGILGLSLPAQEFLPLIAQAGLPDGIAIGAARLGGVVDITIAIALIRAWRPPMVAAVQGVMVLGYTAAFTLLAPTLWALPLGGLLKNIPILALIWVHYILERER